MDIRKMTDTMVDRVVRVAWQDRVTFDEIKKSTGLSEREVIKVMRRHLKASSFRCWRKRVWGRTTKHGRLFKQERKALKLPSRLDPFENRDGNWR